MRLTNSLQLGSVIFRIANNPFRNWILFTGTWNDGGMWNDDALWND